MAESSAVPGISFQCTYCHVPLQAAQAQAGQEFACTSCRAIMLVPALAGEAPAPVVSAVTSLPVAREDVPQQVAAPTALDAVVPLAVAEVPQTVEGVRSSQASVEAPVARAEQLGARVASGARWKTIGSGQRPRVQPRAPKPPSGTKFALWAGLLGVVIAVVAYVAMTVSENMARAKLIQEIDGMAAQAQAALQTGEIAEAGKHAAAATHLLKTASGPLAPEKRQTWEEAFQKIAAYQARLDEVAALLKAATPGTAAKAKEQLQRKKALLDPRSAETRPLLDKLDLALLEVTRREHEHLKAGLWRELEDAGKAFVGGDIEGAMRKAEQVSTQMAANEALKDPAALTRIDRMRQFGRKLAEAKAARAGAQADFTGALKKLDEMAAKLDLAPAEHKPVLAYLQKARKEVQEEEKVSKRFSPQELSNLARIAQQLSHKDPGIAAGEPQAGRGVPLNYNGGSLNLEVERVKDETKLVLSAAGQRFRVSEKILDKHPGLLLRTVQSLGKAMQVAKVTGGETWLALEEAPFPAARRTADGQEQVFYADKLYACDLHRPPVAEAEALQAFQKAAEDLAQAVEADGATPMDVRQTLAVVVRGAYKKLDKNDFLPSEFCRKALADGYLEKNLPGSAQRLKAPLEHFQRTLAALERLSPVLKGKGQAGDEFEMEESLTDHIVFRTYDPQAGVTSFGIKHPVEERPLLFIVYDFAGRLDAFPKAAVPKTVRMTHPAAGVISSYDPASGKLESDPESWALAAAMTTVPRHEGNRWLGTPQWAFPPHLLLVDAMGNPQGIVTPSGRVDLPHFGAIPEVAKRRLAQDAYLETVARVLNSTGYLGLYFVYFHQYVLDSPLVTATGLLGSRAHSGDIHQDIYESLDRELGGHYLGDCDDLAEFYHVVTRKQGKLSFVMALPAHAACGWVEQEGNQYLLQFLDTGPPRIFKFDNLEKLLEIGSRSYDFDRTMRFDPKSLGFLFRFAGEKTRTPYWLSSRMFVDREYARIMEEVQSFWHFHFYALGIKVMEEMIGKGDRVPENCTELAGLYGQVRETKKSIHWTNEALAQLGPEDVLSRMSETFRVGSMHRQDRDKEAAFEAIKGAVADLLRNNTRPPQERMRYVSNRLTFSGLLNSVDRPWDAWNLLEPDATLFKDNKVMRLDHAGALTGIYRKMKEQAAEPGKVLSDAQRSGMARLDALLKDFYGRMVFQPDDDYGDILRKYTFIGMYYATNQGKDKLLEELLKDGPFPSAERNHAKRDEAEDWKWVRLSMLSYGQRIGEALDPEEPPEKWRKDEAAKLAVAMFKAAPQAQKMGSLSTAEIMLSTSRVIHAFLTRDWKEFETVLQDVKHKDFARLTGEVAETFGQCARFVTPQEFVAQYRVFTKYVTAKAPYFSIVYEAYRVESYEHARLAAAEALRHWPKDVNMKREAQYLEELIQARLAEKQAREKAKLEKKGATPPTEKNGSKGVKKSSWVAPRASLAARAA